MPNSKSIRGSDNQFGFEKIIPLIERIGLCYRANQNKTQNFESLPESDKFSKFDVSRQDGFELRQFGVVDQITNGQYLPKFRSEPYQNPLAFQNMANLLNFPENQRFIVPRYLTEEPPRTTHNQNLSTFCEDLSVKNQEISHLGHFSKSFLIPKMRSEPMCPQINLPQQADAHPSNLEQVVVRSSHDVEVDGEDEYEEGVMSTRDPTIEQNEDALKMAQKKRVNFCQIYERQKNKFSDIPIEDVLVLFVFRALGYLLTDEDRQQLGLAFESAIKNEFIKEVFKFHRVVFPFRNNCGKNEEAKRVQKSIQKRLKKNLDTSETILACRLMNEMRELKSFKDILSKNATRKKFITDFSKELRRNSEFLKCLRDGDNERLFKFLTMFKVFGEYFKKKDCLWRAREEFQEINVQFLTKNRYLKLTALVKIQKVKSFKVWCDEVRLNPTLQMDVLFKHKIYRQNILENLFEALLRHLVEYINALKIEEFRNLKKTREYKNQSNINILVHIAKVINNSYKIRGFQNADDNRRTLKMMVHRGMALESCRYFIWKITSDENGTWKRKSWKIIPLNRFRDVLGKGMCRGLLTENQIADIEAYLDKAVQKNA